MVHHPSVDFKNYIASEQFIWDELLERGEAAANKAKEIWGRRRKLQTVILAWPAVAIQDDAGNEVSDVVTLAVPENVPLHQALRDLTQRVLPYALLVAEVRKKELVVVLESHHGTRSWHYPIKRRGDVMRLGQVVRRDNADSLGVLWRPRTQTFDGRAS